MFDITKETPILFGKGKDLLHGHPTRQMLYYWSKVGIKGRKGKRIKLESIKLPAGSATSLEAYRRFISRLTES